MLVEATTIRAASITQLLTGVTLTSELSIFYHLHQHFLIDPGILPEYPNDFARWVAQSLNNGVVAERLANLKARTDQFRAGLAALGLESIPGPHPVVPLLVRDTDRTRAMVRGLYERGILVVGLTYPVVPKGSETIRFQVNAAHTRTDIDEVLSALRALKGA